MCRKHACVHACERACASTSVWNDGWGGRWSRQADVMRVCVWVWQALSIFKLRGVSAVLFFSSAGWKPLGWISSFNTAGRLCLHWLQRSVLDANAVHLCSSAHQSLHSIMFFFFWAFYLVIFGALLARSWVCFPRNTQANKTYTLNALARSFG